MPEEWGGLAWNGRHEGIDSKSIIDYSASIDKPSETEIDRNVSERNWWRKKTATKKCLAKKIPEKNPSTD